MSLNDEMKSDLRRVFFFLGGLEVYCKDILY